MADKIMHERKTFYRYPKAKSRVARNYYSGPGGFLHRTIYTAHHGPIPPGFHVHHIDGDTLNNSPENLEALSPGDHNRRHPTTGRAARPADLLNIQKAIAAATEKSNEPERKAAFASTIKKMWATRQKRTILCTVCGSPKQTLCLKPMLYCSKSCGQKARRTKNV